MPQGLEKISEHVSIVKVEEPVALPHCADVHFKADFGDGRTIDIRTRVPLKPLGAPATVPMTTSDEARKAQAMNLLLDTLRNHGSIVKVEEPLDVLPHEGRFKADFGDGRTVNMHIHVPMTTSDEDRKMQVMKNFLLETLRELDPVEGST